MALGKHVSLSLIGGPSRVDPRSSSGKLSKATSSTWVARQMEWEPLESRRSLSSLTTRRVRQRHTNSGDNRAWTGLLRSNSNTPARSSITATQLAVSRLTYCLRCPSSVDVSGFV